MNDNFSGVQVTGLKEHEAIKPSAPYYKHPTIPGLEARHVIEAFPYHIATAMAYEWRCGRKPGIDPITDLEKAIDHLRFEIERLRKAKQ